MLKKIKYLEHYALWVFMFLFVFDYHFWENNWLEAIRETSLELSIYILIFYTNYKVLIPTFLAKKKNVSYVFSLLIFLSLYIILIKKSGLESHLYEGGLWRNVISMTINFGLFWLISILYWYYQKLQEEREKQFILETEKLATEIRFLKNQISPHFIFNTLNNIYSLVQQGHKNAASMLAQLSTILRYILYESSKNTVPLAKELKTIQDYIQLQLLRKPKSINIDFYQEGNYKQLEIAPLILLNFVENCFKHSNIDTSKAAWIKISCIVLEDNQLEFTTENSKSKKIPTSKDGGLGNQNILRQLELKYGNRHKLAIEDKEEAFKMVLKLQL